MSWGNHRQMMTLDPRSVPYRVFERSISIVVFVALAVALGGGGEGAGGTVMLVAFILVAFVGWEIAYVKRFTYQETEDTFDIQSGVLSRREREIPFERIQNVDIAQNVFQRAIGIAEVRLETAGGGESEARLRYVSKSEATRLQELISKRKRGDTERDPGASDDILFELESRELGILGVTSANFRLFGLIVFAVLVFGSAGAQQTDFMTDGVVEPRMTILLLLGPALAAVGLFIIWIISGVQAVLRYYGFRLLRHDEELRYERGLFQRYNGTIPLSKVQTLMIRENLFARAAGYANLVIETAGYAPGQGSDSVESAVPIAKRNRVFELANTIEDFGEIEFKRAPKRARTRYLGRYTIVVAIVVGLAGGYHALTNALPDWYYAAILWLLVPPAAHLKWTHIGYFYTDRHIITRLGFWTRRTTIVPYYRLQTVTDSQTIFQRRRRLGTLIVDTASSGGFWGGDAIALDIDIDVARELRETVHDEFHESISRREALFNGDGKTTQQTNTDGVDSDTTPVTDGGTDTATEKGSSDTATENRSSDTATETEDSTNSPPRR